MAPCRAPRQPRLRRREDAAGSTTSVVRGPASADLTRNIGISAHIDSGKTTLTERILYYTGRINNIHDVRGKDGVGAKMDSMDLEREKGITIQSAATHCSVGTRITSTSLIRRATSTLRLRWNERYGCWMVAFWCCVVSRASSRNLTVDRQMKRYDVPRVAFVNKLDRAGANPDKVVEQLRDQMALHACSVQMPIGCQKTKAPC